MRYPPDVSCVSCSWLNSYWSIGAIKRGVGEAGKVGIASQPPRSKRSTAGHRAMHVGIACAWEGMCICYVSQRPLYSDLTSSSLLCPMYPQQEQRWGENMAAEATTRTSQNKAHSMTACVRGCPGAQMPTVPGPTPWTVEPKRAGPCVGQRYVIARPLGPTDIYTVPSTTYGAPGT